MRLPAPFGKDAGRSLAPLGDSSGEDPDQHRAFVRQPFEAVLHEHVLHEQEVVAAAWRPQVHHPRRTAQERVAGVYATVWYLGVEEVVRRVRVEPHRGHSGRAWRRHCRWRGHPVDRLKVARLRSKLPQLVRRQRVESEDRPGAGNCDARASGALSHSAKSTM